MKGSWKVEENQMIKKQNALLQKVIATFGKVSGALSMWRECLNDIRRKQRSNSHDGSNDYTDRGTAEYHGRDASGDTGKGREEMCIRDRIVAIVFIMFALNHPEKSFPWNNTITWLLYGCLLYTSRCV